MKYVILILVLILAGCSTGDKPMTEKENIRTSCLDGVVYYMFREGAGHLGYGYMAVKYNRDGTIATCGY